MWVAHNLLYLMISLAPWAVHVESSDIGDQVSEIVQNFADEGLGTGEMQEYITREVNFETETIDEGTVEEIAKKMSDKIKRRIDMLEDLQRDLETLTDIKPDIRGYHTCCTINPQGESSIHGDNVNLDHWCLLGDVLANNDPPGHFLPISILDNFKDVYDRDGDIKYVYFGSEDGVLYNYPGIKVKSCDNYDPRFRPWYVETATPEPKDVVIVIDRSNSMSNTFETSDKSLMDVAKEAAITVVDTLNPNDRAGIVVFSTEAETPPGGQDTCYRTTLAKANPKNKDYLRRYIAYISPEGDSHYNKGLHKAFDYFSNAPEDDNAGPERDKVLLFLTDGEPTDEDAPESIYSTLSQLNGQLNNTVVVLTYFLSIAANKDAEDILTNLAEQIFSNSSYGDITLGKFSHVSQPDNLRTEMAAYYNIFKSGTVNSEPTFSVPFLDTFGTSSVQIAMCLPVTRTGNLKGGVVCLDHLVDDILSEVTYFRKGGTAYAFVIDGKSRVLSHPLLTNPADITNNPVFIELGSLEFGDGIEDVRESMVSGATGMKTLTSRRVTARGSLDTEGVNSKQVLSTYFWHPVEGTHFSVCIVKTDRKNYEGVHWNRDYPSQFSYHKTRIAANPSDTCKYFAREALIGQGNVKFAPRSFLQPYHYIFGEETTSDSQGYENYFTGKRTSNSWFRSEVRDHVAFSYKFEEIMESRQRYGDHAVWRYIGTEAGVVRLYPGAEISTMYDPSLRSWYLRAISSPSLFSISTPYNDAFGAGNVITLSKALLSPSENIPVGVMGVDFTMPYFYFLLTQDIPDCSKYECLVIDRSGFIILDSKWFESGAKEIEYIEGIHISSVEPEIAYDLANDGVLDSSSCINMQDLKEQKFWKMALSTIDEGFRSKTWYELHEISDTNIYLLIKKDLPGDEENCHCPSNQNNIELCSSSDYTCYCPCFTTTDVYSYCSGVFSLSLDDDPPCSPPIPSVDFSHLTDTEQAIIKYLDPCRDYKCGARDSREQCVGVASCTWCDTDTFSESFCAAWGDCHLGPLTTPPLADLEPNPQNGPATWIIAVAVVGGLLLITVLIMVVVCIVKRRTAKDDLTRSNTIPNQYIGLENSAYHGEAGPSSLEEGSGQPKGDEIIYDKLRESKLNIHAFTPVVTIQDWSLRPKSEGLPPTPDEMPLGLAPDLQKAKTLPPGLQALPDVYISSATATNPTVTEAGLQSVSTEGEHQGESPISNSTTEGEDIYLKARSMPAKNEDDANMYLTAAGLPSSSGHQQRHPQENT